MKPGEKLTPEKVAELTGKGTATVFIVCRSANDSMPPGAKKGYFCKGCGLEVQVTAPNQPMVAAGGLVFCNPCGLTIAEWKAAQGNLGHVETSATFDAAVGPGGDADPRRMQQIDFLKKSVVPYPD